MPSTRPVRSAARLPAAGQLPPPWAGAAAWRAPWWAWRPACAAAWQLPRVSSASTRGPSWLPIGAAAWGAAARQLSSWLPRIPAASRRSSQWSWRTTTGPRRWRQLPAWLPTTIRCPSRLPPDKWRTWRPTRLQLPTSGWTPASAARAAAAAAAGPSAPWTLTLTLTQQAVAQPAPQMKGRTCIRPIPSDWEARVGRGTWSAWQEVMGVAGAVTERAWPGSFVVVYVPAVPFTSRQRHA
mmetsp:Transcript_70429/g.181519  ORF Transcript_70429/g.181519 Transcript_70429/m.181519 type:complete len:239 (+) Transcript_70429:628-1344(+)